MELPTIPTEISIRITGISSNRLFSATISTFVLTIYVSNAHVLNDKRYTTREFFSYPEQITSFNYRMNDTKWRGSKK